MTLRLDQVGYRYAGASGPALMEIDLELRAGSVVGLAGPSDAGKTTLCLVASGLAPRTVGGQIRGTITLDGEDVDAWPMHRLSERIGIGFQNPSTQLSQVAATVFEEVAFGPMNLGIERVEVIDRTWEALESLGIAGLGDREPARLSGGQQQLVAMAGLLALRPEHLILDEPTAQLDPAGTRLVGDAIARLAGEGASILVAEQKTDLLASLADEIVVLTDGQITLRGGPDEVFGDPRLWELDVPEPAAVRLSRLAAESGVAGPAFEEALRG